MKAVFRLNEEKLDFNHKVLFEREKVNKTTIESLKRKRRHYQEVLRTVKEKYDAQILTAANFNKAMTKDYKKFTREFLLL